VVTESRKRTITTGIIDVVLILLFIGSAEPRPTGILWHEWLGIGFGVVAVVHIYRSWDWIVAALSRIFTHQTATTRFSLMLNILVFVATTREVVGGLLPTVLKLGAWASRRSKWATWPNACDAIGHPRNTPPNRAYRTEGASRSLGLHAA
jgi:hypothetical protein